MPRAQKSCAAFGSWCESANANRWPANAEKNLANARELFESGLGAAFEDQQAWTTTTIGQIGDVFDGPHATPTITDQGPIFLGIEALRDGELVIGKMRHVSRDTFEQWTRRVRPAPDDVVFSYETRLGQAAIIPEDLECCLGRRMGLVRVDRSRIDPKFFLYSYISPQYRQFLETKIMRGATVDRLSIRDFPSFSFAYPSLERQHKIVALVEAMIAANRQLRVHYEAKIASYSNLKQSILARAFSGQLTASKGLAA